MLTVLALLISNGKAFHSLVWQVKERSPRIVLDLKLDWIYLTYMGACRWTEYGFWPRCPQRGI